MSQEMLMIAAAIADLAAAVREHGAAVERAGNGAPKIAG